MTVAVAGFAALAGAGQPANVDVARPQPTARVKEVADASLRDVAVAVYDSLNPVIYVNPRLMKRFSPELQTFFMAHEYAHIELRHTRASALRGDVGTRDRLLQAKELEADCLAAERLGRSRRDATFAAARFFGRLATTQYDTEHPTGSDRARKILSCMPE
jgi:hypothetical protein